MEEEEMAVILEEFVYGRDHPPTIEETNIIEAFLASEELTDLVESLMIEHKDARETADVLNMTNAKERVK
jgi:hypothetical protein